jgi:hypothetical protein
MLLKKFEHHFLQFHYFCSRKCLEISLVKRGFLYVCILKYVFLFCINDINTYYDSNWVSRHSSSLVFVPVGWFGVCYLYSMTLISPTLFISWIVMVFFISIVIFAWIHVNIVLRVMWLVDVKIMNRYVIVS